MSSPSCELPPLRATKSCDDGALRMSLRRNRKRKSAQTRAASGRRRRSTSLQDFGVAAAATAYDKSSRCGLNPRTLDACLNMQGTAWGGRLCTRFCNMFSGSSPCLLGQHGSCNSAQLPVELLENMLQNLFLNLPPQTVPLMVSCALPVISQTPAKLSNPTLSRYKITTADDFLEVAG